MFRFSDGPKPDASRIVFDKFTGRTPPQWGTVEWLTGRPQLSQEEQTDGPLNELFDDLRHARNKQEREQVQARMDIRRKQIREQNG